HWAADNATVIGMGAAWATGAWHDDAAGGGVAIERCGTRARARPIAAQAGTAGTGSERMAVVSELDRQNDIPASMESRDTISRRAWLIGGGVAAMLVAAGLVRRWRGERASVFIAKNQSYHGDL